jgi:hypothetical protein
MQLDFCRSLLFKKSDGPTIIKVHTLLQFWRHQPLLTLMTPRRKCTSFDQSHRQVCDEDQPFSELHKQIDRCCLLICNADAKMICMTFYMRDENKLDQGLYISHAQNDVSAPSFSYQVEILCHRNSLQYLAQEREQQEWPPWLLITSPEKSS